MMVALDEGSTQVILGVLASVTAVIIAIITKHQLSKVKVSVDETLADTKPNGGGSSRDLLDRLDRRSLLMDDRITRQEIKFDRLLDVPDRIQELAELVTITHTRILELNGRVGAVEDVVKGGEI